MTAQTINAEALIEKLNTNGHVEVATDWMSLEDAAAILASLPKSLKAFQNFTNGTFIDGQYVELDTPLARLAINVNPITEKTTGAQNEAAERRIRRFAAGVNA